MGNEVEIKIRIDDVGEAIERIERLGATLVRGRVFEDNRLYDLEGDSLYHQDKLLRLRVIDGRGIVTVKAPAPETTSSPYKVRREIETEVRDPDAMAAALETVGFTPRWRYQKYRREWSLGAAHIMLDEIPWGAWVEVEGAPEQIDEITAQLGWGRDRWDRGSYRELHERYCDDRGVPVGDMVFGAEVSE